MGLLDRWDNTKGFRWSAAILMDHLIREVSTGATDVFSTRDTPVLFVIDTTPKCPTSLTLGSCRSVESSTCFWGAKQKPRKTIKLLMDGNSCKFYVENLKFTPSEECRSSKSKK